jgi:DNA/RNA endonuclease YhcR with UshA esterase domain
MYSVNRDCGFSINDLILNKISLDQYEEKYVKYFETIHRKSPTNHAGVQKNNAKYFLEFINDKFLIEIGN